MKPTCTKVYEKCRNLNYRSKEGGCGLIHVCPSKTCGQIGCYEHLPMTSEDFDFGALQYAVICNCGYSLKGKIAVRSSFQGAIPCFLCSRNSNASCSTNSLKFLQEYYTAKENAFSRL